MHEHHKLSLSRRALLRNVGGLCISAPLMRSLAYAQAAGDLGPLKRVVFICGESGSAGYWWRPQGGENDFNIGFEGAVLSPLIPLRQKLLILNGVGNYAASFGGVDNHEVRSVTFTAYANSKPGDPNYARGPSVDRGIVERLKEKRPLYASIGGPAQGPGSEYYYAGPGNPIAGVGTTVGIFDALFANVSSNLTQDNGQGVSQVKVFQKSLWEEQLSEAKLLRSRLNADAQLKLDEYLTTLQEKIAMLKDTVTSPITVPPRPSNPDYSQTIKVDGPYNLYSRDLDLVASGLILGVTQVACLKLHHGVIEDSFVGRSIDTYDQDGRKTGSRQITDYHQHVAHMQLVGDQYRNLAPTLMARSVHHAQAKVVAQFLLQLDAAVEKDGSTVLDNTLVVWTTQMGDQSAHRSGRLPYVLAGGLGQKMKTFRMGRFLDYAPSGIKSYEDLDAARCAVPQHLLLNSVQKTFGIERDVFGENLSDRCRGYLPRAT